MLILVLVATVAAADAGPAGQHAWSYGEAMMAALAAALALGLAIKLLVEIAAHSIRERVRTEAAAEATRRLRTAGAAPQAQRVTVPMEGRTRQPAPDALAGVRRGDPSLWRESERVRPPRVETEATAHGIPQAAGPRRGRTSAGQGTRPASTQGWELMEASGRFFEVNEFGHARPVRR